MSYIRKNVAYSTPNGIIIYKRGLRFRNESIQPSAAAEMNYAGSDKSSDQDKPLNSSTTKRHYWFPPTFIN